MKFWTTSKRHRGVGLLAVALMLLLWLGTFALTASPELHRLFHADSKNADHRCLISQLQHHPLLAGFAAPVAPAAAPAGFAAACGFEFQFVPAQDSRLSLSRGPPSLVSSIPVAG